jgi:formiminotetrahydrofolate cyclodeaminase
VPLVTVVACASVLDIAEEAAPILNASAISDVLVGALLAQAAVTSAALNVEVNLAAMTDAAAVDGYSSDFDRARSGAEERLERTLAAGRSRFPRPARKV